MNIPNGCQRKCILIIFTEPNITLSPLLPTPNSAPLTNKMLCRFTNTLKATNLQKPYTIHAKALKNHACMPIGFPKINPNQYRFNYNILEEALPARGLFKYMCHHLSMNMLRSLSALPRIIKY